MAYILYVPIQCHCHKNGAKVAYCISTLLCKAVVGGMAGQAMAVPLFWPKMVLAEPLFWPIMIFFCWVIFSADHNDQSLSNNIDN